MTGEEIARSVPLPFTVERGTVKLMKQLGRWHRKCVAENAAGEEYERGGKEIVDRATQGHPRTGGLLMLQDTGHVFIELKSPDVTVT